MSSISKSNGPFNSITISFFRRIQQKIRILFYIVATFNLVNVYGAMFYHRSRRGDSAVGVRGGREGAGAG